MDIKFNSRDPVYYQVVQHFKRQIVTGNLEPGQTIPSRRELATMLKINPNTAQRAYKEMEEEGLIRTESNQPSKVTHDLATIRAVRDALLQEAAEQYVLAVQAIGITLSEALALVEKRFASTAEEANAND